ncbi:hypothetical protein LUZ60_013815 [Juncus effusus]|nr:hypothetical protein LUZ60_013815 [Juncus effusus]
MEDTKWAFLDALSDDEIGDCFQRIKNLEELARGCYQSKIELSSDEFVQILFVDSMFILLLLIDDANSHSGMLSYVFDDLLMLQNQIPFFIVQEMWDAVFLEARDTNLATILQGTRFGGAGLSNSLVLGDTCHLLDLYCKWVLPIPARVSNCQGPNWFLLRMQSWFRSWFSQPQTQAADEGTNSSTQSATELYEAGVKFKFKPKKEFKNFLDISFENGILKIPTLTLNSSSMSRLANVLLHEITNAVSQEEFYVTSYVFFMDSLIRTKKDIMLLQKFGVLDNKLKSGDEAVDFIKSLRECIGTLPVDAVNKNFYAPMIQDMMKYTASSWHRNWASLKRTYFSNPWKGISVIAGSSLLILGFVQTYYSAYPYYHHHFN